MKRIHLYINTKRLFSCNEYIYFLNYVYLHYQLGTDEKIGLKDLLNIIVKIIWSRVLIIIGL